jgi:ketosteroid isomerase-like protein
MSQENVEIVRRVLEANRSEGLDALEELLPFADPNCEYTSIVAGVEPKVYRGRDGLRRYHSDLAEAFDEWRNEVEEVFDLTPDTVYATIRSRVVGKGSGVAVEAQLAVIFVFSGGKIVRGGTYPSREAALEAAGLRE